MKREGDVSVSSQRMHQAGPVAKRTMSVKSRGVEAADRRKKARPSDAVEDMQKADRI